MIRNLRKSKLVTLLIVMMFLLVGATSAFANGEVATGQDESLGEKAEYAIGITDTGKVIKGSLNPDYNPRLRATGNAGESVSKTYGGYTSHTQIITVDGEIGYCVQPEKDVPNNTDYHETVQNNAQLRTVLFYGYGGVDSSDFMALEGGDVNNAYMDTWMAARIANGESISNPAVVNDPCVRWLLDHATAPQDGFIVGGSPKNATWTASTKRQETDWYTTTGAATFTVEVSGTGVGVQFQGENEVHWTNQTRNTGASFKLVADKSKEGQVKINVPTTASGKAALLFVPSNDGNVQNVVGLGKGSDPLDAGEAVANFTKPTFPPDITKRDDNADWQASAESNDGKKGQGDGTLDGAVYGIYDIDDNNKLIAQGTVANNNIDFGQIVVGNHYIQEITPPQGYQLDTTKYPLENWEKDKKVHIDVKQTVITGGLQIQKWDKELDKSEALGGKDHGNNVDGTHLEGTEVTITNRSANAVLVKGKVYKPGEVIMTLTTKWNEAMKAYTAETGANDLPYGMYGAKETKTAQGYLLTDGTEKLVKIEEQGKIVTVDKDGNPLNFKNQVIRGDFRFNKIANDTNEAMSVAWVVTNDITGERHVIATDRNGVFTSSRRHSVNTNGNDALLAKIDAGEEIKTSELQYTNGIWFSQGEDGSRAAVNDALSAMIYGGYTIKEARCEGNKNADLKTFKLWIYEDGVEIDRGTITNNVISVTTEALDKKTEDHIGLADKEAAVGDKVWVDGLQKNVSYVIKGKAVNYEDGKDIVIDGNAVIAEKEVKSRNGGVELKLDYNYDATSLAGKSVVFGVEVYEKDGMVKVAEHKELDNADQTIHYPKIQTTATDTVTGDHYGYAGEQVTHKDKVTYTNLIANEKYETTCFAYIQETGEKLLDKDGNPVFAKKEFTPSTPDGFVEVEVTFDASLLAGKSIVYFEDVKFKEITIALHADINDKDQTISFPKIGTKASIVETGLQEAMLGMVKIQDIIGHELMPTDKEMRAEGIIMDRDSWTPIIVNGETVTAEVVFTPENPDGEVIMPFEFDATEFAGKTLVVAEKVFVVNPDGDDILIADHEDPNDEGQTIRIPKIKTTAWGQVQGNKTIEARPEQLTGDDVEFNALTPGKEHEVVGQLYIGDGEHKGQPLMINGEPVIVRKKFTPETENGIVALETIIDASALEGQSVVWFEDIYLEGTLVGQHHDIDDEGQTVKVVPVAKAVETGDNAKLGVMLAVLVVAAAGFGIMVYRRRKVGADK